MFESELLRRAARAALCMQRNNWEQGVLAQAFLEWGDGETAILLAREAAYRQDERGRCAQIGGSNACTDPCAVGEALEYARARTADPLMEQAVGRLLNWAVQLAPRNGSGVIYHVDNAPQFWADSMYMLPPFLVRMGRCELALAQIDGWWNALYDPGAGLMRHIWNDGSKQFDRAAFWGAASGWTVAAFARVIALLPQEYASARRLLADRLNGLIDAMLRHMRPDGLFHDVLDDPASFVETNAAQMLAYAIFRGVQLDVVPRTRLDPAMAMRAAAHAKVDSFGLVQDVCGAPAFDRPGVSAEGQAFLILMEAACRDAGLQ